MESDEAIFERIRERGRVNAAYIRTRMLSLGKKIRSDRWLSEEELCDVWDYLSLPPGFSRENGSVLLSGYPERLAIRHKFAALHTIILCVCPGQFVQPLEKLQPGKRIASLQNMAPDLITCFGNEVVILVGRQGDIYNRLGLLYRFQVIL